MANRKTCFIHLMPIYTQGRMFAIEIRLIKVGVWDTQFNQAEHRMSKTNVLRGNLSDLMQCHCWLCISPMNGLEAGLGHVRMFPVTWC